jgi:hypothetical protein
VNDEQHAEGEHLLASFQADPNTDTQYMIDTTEKWAKSRGLYNALLDSIAVQKGEKAGIASELMFEAENFSFKKKSLSDHFMKLCTRTKKKNRVISGIMSPEDVTLFV